MNGTKAHKCKGHKDVPLAEITDSALMQTLNFDDAVVELTNGRTEIVDYSTTRQAIRDYDALTRMIREYGADVTLGTLKGELLQLVRMTAIGATR